MNKKFRRMNKKFDEGDEQKIIRVPLPKQNQLIGIIKERHGGNKMRVLCLDGKERNCRVPGRFKRELWLRPDDVVMVELWELDKDKGDIILKYRSTQIEWLKKQGYLKKEATEF